MRISDWSSDVCSSDLHRQRRTGRQRGNRQPLLCRRQGGADVAALRRDLRHRQLRPGGRLRVVLVPHQADLPGTALGQRTARQLRPRILALTVVIKLIFFPLANKSYKSMAKMRMLQPKMMELRERYGEDKQRLNQEMMTHYKKEGANPLSGCLPILLQIPVFFALYKVMFVPIEMRQLGRPFVREKGC